MTQGLPESQKCLQWHSVRVAQALEGAVVLASSPNRTVQAMRVGQNAWSMQCHIDVDVDTVDNWSATPAYHEALIAALGSTRCCENAICRKRGNGGTSAICRAALRKLHASCANVIGIA